MTSTANSTTTPGTEGSPGASARATAFRLAWILVSLAVVTAALAVFGVEHNPSYTFSIFGSAGADAIDLKSKIATGVLGLAILQLLLALWIYGRLPAVPKAAKPVRQVHRTVGIVAFLATLPVAGGLVVTLVGVLWYTSALWFLNNYRLPG